MRMRARVLMGARPLSQRGTLQDRSFPARADLGRQPGGVEHRERLVELPQALEASRDAEPRNGRFVRDLGSLRGAFVQTERLIRVTVAERDVRAREVCFRLPVGMGAAEPTQGLIRVAAVASRGG